jgi:hypothetical protein
MKYLIDKEKFLEEIEKSFVNTEDILRPAQVVHVLSKHLRSLPKKKSTLPSQVENKMELDVNEGYNRALKDCEGR